MLVATCLAASSRAATYYVAPTGNDANAGTNWVTAKRYIQAAVDLAVDGDTVMVTNGTYAGPGRTYGTGTLTNRVIITNEVLVTSVTGPNLTIIAGNNASFDRSVAVRCVLMTKGTLSGFLLDSGACNTNLLNSADYNGGGAYLVGGVISNCVVQSCRSPNSGAGVSGPGASGAIVDSTIRFCTASNSGGGAVAVTVNRCVLHNNLAQRGYGGGTYYAYVYNSLIRNNQSGTNAGGVFGNFDTFNCTIVNNTAGGTGGGVDYVNLRNCIVWSNNASFGDPNIGGSGAAAVNSCAPVLLAGTGNITNHPLFVEPTNTNWRLVRASPCSDAGNNAYVSGAADVERLTRVVNGTVDIGCFERQVWHVATNGSDAADGLSWATAKQTIQGGVDAARVGEKVLVSNGLYATGSKLTPGYVLPNRVVITNDLVVTSVNGPAFTTIQGSNATVNAGMRCVYITSGHFSGFTLTNGAAPYTNVPGLNIDASNLNLNAGGAYAVGAVISNCVFAGNNAFYYGGGSFGGTIANCSYIGNSASGGAGAYTGLLNNCMFRRNIAGGYGGGVMYGTIYNSFFNGNTSSYGGAIFFSQGYNLTIVGNRASTQGGGADGGRLYNSIVYFNTSPSGSNSVSSGFTNSCTAPLAPGPGNTAADPRFLDAAQGDARLKAGSPAIDNGNNTYAGGSSDVTGNARIVNATVDMGAYEYDQALASYDSDSDGFSDQEEYWADTQPTNIASFFPDAVVTPTAPGETLFTINPSSTGRVYDVYATTDLLASPQVWTWISGGVPGNAGALNLAVTNDAEARAYRTSVRPP